jgi:hypothetical protein
MVLNYKHLIVVLTHTIFMILPLAKKKNFSFAAGVGFANENYYFKKYRLNWHKDTITKFVPFGDSINSKTSKLGLIYFDIPIEFRYRSKPSAKTGMSWKLAAGFKLGFFNR